MQLIAIISDKTVNRHTHPNRFLFYILIITLAMMALSEANAEVAKVDGDIYVAGLFEVQSNEGGQCGTIDVDSVMTLEATRWYIEQFNTNNVFPFKIGFQGYKTCRIPSQAVEHALDITCRHRNVNTTGQQDDFFVGFIGPSTSEEAKHSAAILSSSSSSNRFLLISPSATAVGLEDRQLFPNFFRVVPNDSQQIQTMITLMKELGWNRIAIVYENGTYGREAAIYLQQLAQKSLICISNMFAIGEPTHSVDTPGQIDAILDTIMLKSPTIEGVVLFGSKKIAGSVMRAVDNKGVDKVPLFILSESVGLKGDIFRSSGAILQKTKGSLVISAPYTEITSFSDYWLSLMTNVTLLREQMNANPWLDKIYETVAGCSATSQSSACGGLTSEQVEQTFPVQPVQLKYSILAAHVMIKALTQLYTKVCQGIAGDCISYFKNQFKPHMMIDTMTDLSIDFGADFDQKVSVEPLTSSRYQLTFGNTSEPANTSDHNMYEIFNFKKAAGLSSGDGDTFSLSKVGSYKYDGGLDLQIDDLRDYDSSGMEKRFPNIRRGRCPDGMRCSECMNHDLLDVHIHVRGDLYVVGLVPINNKATSKKSGCGSVRTRNGYQIALALQYGVEEFNMDSIYSKYRDNFRGKQIGLIVLNSCDDAITSTRKVMNLEQTGIVLENGEHLNLTNRIIGYVGGLSTWVSAPVAKQLTRINKVQVSYASTYPFLSDKTLYPYFMRIVTKDDEQAETIMQVVKAIGGEYIQVLYSECPCGVSGIVTLTTAAEKHGVCIAQSIEVKPSDKYDEYYEFIRKKPHAKIIIVYLNLQILVNFMKGLDKEISRGEFHLICAKSWGKNTDLLELDIAKGSLTVALEMDASDNLTSYIENKVPNRDESNPWLDEYIQTRQDCFFDWSYDKTFSRKCMDDDYKPIRNNDKDIIDGWSPFATIAMWSLLMGSAEFYAKTCGESTTLCPDYMDNPSGLVNEMKKLTLNSRGSDNIRIFDDNGDGNMGYQIYNVQEEPLNRNTLKYVKVGQFNLKTGLDLNTSAIIYPTDDKIVSTCPNVQACQNCFKTEAEKSQISTDTSEAGIIILAVLTGILGSVVIGLVTLLIITWKRVPEEDHYITPHGELTRPHVDGQQDSPYHSAEMTRESTY